MTEDSRQLPRLCNRPPAGWSCSREPDHEGPCAARQIEDDSIAITSVDLSAAIDRIIDSGILDEIASDAEVPSALARRDLAVDAETIAKLALGLA